MINDEGRGSIVLFTGTEKPSHIPDPCILITTYSILRDEKKAAADTAQVLNEVTKRDWGFLVLDEVHGLPAKESRQNVIGHIKAHVTLGLTATLVREDEKIEDLVYLIGPKLYEANWLDLQEQGFLARVQCIEVPCKMDPEFFRHYIQLQQERNKDTFVLGCIM